MGSSTQDRYKSKANKFKGEVKKGLGRLTNDPELEARGSMDKIKGHGQGALANIKDAAKAGARKAASRTEKTAGRVERATSKSRH